MSDRTTVGFPRVRCSCEPCYLPEILFLKSGNKSTPSLHCGRCCTFFVPGSSIYRKGQSLFFYLEVFAQLSLPHNKQQILMQLCCRLRNIATTFKPSQSRYWYFLHFMQLRSSFLVSNDLLLLTASRTVLMATPCHYGVEQLLNLTLKKSTKSLHLSGLRLIFRAVTRP